MDDSEDDFEDEAWRPIERVGSRLGWQDMSDYVSTVSDPSLASDLARALEGKGAFRRFKDLVFANGLGDAWHACSDELQLGRARVFLNGLGIRASGR